MFFHWSQDIIIHKYQCQTHVLPCNHFVVLDFKSLDYCREDTISAHLFSYVFMRLNTFVFSPGAQ